MNDEMKRDAEATAEARRELGLAREALRATQ